MNYERSNHASVLLPNGDVLIIGGGSQIPEVFNAKTKTFYKLPVSSNIKDIAIAEKINDKQIIIVSPSNNIIEEFDTENNKLKKIGVFDRLNTSSKNILNYNGVLFFPIETFDNSDLSVEPKEKVVITYYDYKKNIIRNITKPQSVFDFCIGNMIAEVNNELVHFCSKNILYTEIYEKKVNKIYGVSNYALIQTDKKIIIIGGVIGASTVTNEIQTIDIKMILK